jgi:predicted enzyme related to lactoylglutathione lyase
VSAFTVETAEATRMPLKRGAINGGFFARSESAPAQHTKLTILVDEIHEAMARIEAAGGEVLGEPFELPGVGLFVSFRDAEGNVVTVNQDFAIKTLPDA